MQRSCLLSLAVIALASPSEAAPAIRHEPVRCVVAERFPRLEAQFVPADRIARARVLFVGQDGRHWYAVAMKPEGAAFSGLLPRPRKSLAGFRYYIEVVDQDAGVGRTEEYTTTVVRVPGECQNAIVTGGVSSASVTVEVPPGAPPIPAGFSGNGVVLAAGTAVAASAGAAAGGAAAAGGGGISTAAVVGVSALAVGGAAAAVVASRGEEENTPVSPAAGNYALVSLDGAALPTVVVTTPCIGSAVSGMLRLENGDPPAYELTQTTSFQCVNGPGPTNPHTETGEWSESGGVITFRAPRSPIFGLTTGTLNGSTLAMPMDILSEQMGVPPRRYQSVWTKR